VVCKKFIRLQINFVKQLRFAHRKTDKTSLFWSIGNIFDISR
jgi:hypothetical protein